MKKNLVILMALAIMTSMPLLAKKTPAQKLIKRLAKVEKKGKIGFGHHDDTAYGHTWKFVEDKSDVKDVVGDYPAIMNWDLGLIEWERDKQLDGVPFELIRNEVRKQDARGGISTISWHLRNPATTGDSWDTGGENVVRRCITPGDALNDTMKVWLGRAADFIGSLRDSKGNRIAVVFRPWHEHTGSWFWWGYNFCTPEEYKALWKLTHQVFAEKGIDNVVWAYSPDKDHITTESDYMERYPGDDIIDILGADIYHFGGEKGVEMYHKRIKNVLGAAVSLAKKHKKLVAFTETGCESLPIPNWFTEVLYPAIKDYPICYVCVWRNAHDNPTHFYAPYPGHNSVPSFKAFYEYDKILFARDMKKIK